MTNCFNLSLQSFPVVICFSIVDYQSANGLGGMDSFGVQTAVLGMLSLRNGTNDFANSSGFITGVGGGNKPQHQQQRQNGSNTTLPLTPPGWFSLMFNDESD